MKNVLYLGSQSASRRLLLEQAKIPYSIVNQSADESVCDWNLPLMQLVTHIASYKMDHVILHDGTSLDEVRFVVTADTLSQSQDGMVQGKPLNRNDAIQKIKAARGKNTVCTAFCLERKIWDGVAWKTDARIEQTVCAELFFDVPDSMIDWYLDNSIALSCAGAIQIEESGLPFLKSIFGSYTTIVGLPLFELRCALQELGFFDR